MLGLVLFMYFISLILEDWALAIIFTGLFAVVLYYMSRQAVLYPHYKDVGLFYFYRVAVPLFAVAGLTVISSRYDWVLVTYTLPLLLLIIPSVLFHIVKKENSIPIHAGNYGVKTRNMNDSVDNSGTFQKNTGIIIEAEFLGIFGLILLSIILIYYTRTSFLFALILIFVIYAFRIFSKDGVYQYYKSMEKTLKRQASVLMILISLCFAIPFLFSQNLSQHILWTAILLLPIVMVEAFWYRKRMSENKPRTA